LKSTYDEILANRKTDLTTNIHGQFSNSSLENILDLAKNKFDVLIKTHNPSDEDGLQKIWHQVVVDFHTNNYWGFKKNTESNLDQTTRSDVKKDLSLTSFIPAFLIPIIFTKTAILYFGINWGNYPGQGYGYGFFAAILFAVCSFTFFLWRNRGYRED